MVAKNFKDLTGQKFGKLTVIKRVENDIYGAAKWLCKCDCGEELIVQGNVLRNNKVTCCNTCRKESEQE